MTRLERVQHSDPARPGGPGSRRALPRHIHCRFTFCIYDSGVSGQLFGESKGQDIAPNFQEFSAGTFGKFRERLLHLQERLPSGVRVRLSRAPVIK